MMRLAVSNIAWPAAQADAVYDVLAELSVPGLEIAPGILFAGEPDPFVPSEAALRTVTARLDKAGLTLCSMQSLLFGVAGAELFGAPEARGAFEGGLLRAIALAGRLGIPNLVVGSPRNRVIPDLFSPEQVREISLKLFRRLGDRAAQAGCVLAMEPNPAVYGTNFLTTLEETDAFVRAVDHPAVRVNFDVGAMHVNGAFAHLEAALAVSRPRISHVHLSEPQLGPVPGSVDEARIVFAALTAAGWEGWVSIEMRADPDDPVGAVRRAVRATLSAMGAA
ncbi:sugar phosphate isomerase/epimerase family protein [Aquabacter cavernae]|uniref:sugar phosphate isomerase/epimerase family protein n=1 Tax=Aquabacter cavernae TaxID=2496029 RepID=UPI000F8CF6E0|nr:sugar phosphate isomerase/epimerase family protein [Aquabacter cavernae]